ncbi:hypothetical protein GC176_26470 [bacterium]|nr:hypothetical protein [bacterium]
MSDLFPRCQVQPLPDHQVAISIDGRERLRWHYGPNYPRPFFYPLNGPSGVSLTRMGHPGASNHDHHRSVWFAHAKLLGIDFWSDNTSARIRQKHWLVYKDGEDRAVLATQLGWYDGHDPAELLDQTVIAIARPFDDGETLLELQSIFIPKADSLEVEQSNFGFLAVRVAKSISEHFGAGRLTSSEGLVGEKDEKGQPNIFGKDARWMDYSGPIKASITEGITYFDHPANPRYPSKWHVREDGWMGASFCMDAPFVISRRQPLRLRYLLHAHAGPIDAGRADAIAAQFANWPQYDVIRSSKPHQQFELTEVRTS